MKIKNFLLLLLIFTLTFSMISCSNWGNDPDNNPDSGEEQPDNKPDNKPDDNPDDNKPDNKPDNNPDTDEDAVIGTEQIINVYLIAGQSNAVGYGMDTNRKIANSDSRFVNGFENVLYYGDQERWNGGPLTDSFQPVTLGMGVAADRSGAEIGIASAIADNGGMNAIIKCAQGATHLYPDTKYDVSLNYGTWTSPSYIEKNNIDLEKNPMIGEMYRRFERTVRDGLEILVAEGYTPVIKGVWWMQGEAEMFTIDMASEYKVLFTDLISDMRNMLSDASGYDCSETPFVCGLPKWNTNNSPAPTYQGMVRTAMTTVAGELNNVACVDCMPLNQHDDWHFDAQGQKYLGEMFVEELATFEADELFEGKLSINNKIEILTSEKGLQFTANLTKTSSKDNYKYGFILIPTEKLGDISGNYIDNLNSAGIEYQNVSCELQTEKIDDDYSNIFFTAKIADIAYADMNTAYTAIAYVQNEYGQYMYSSRFVSDSIARLASEELYKEGADVDALLRIVNAGINFLSGKPEESAENDPELEIYADDVTLPYSETANNYQLQISKSVDVDYFVRFSSENPEIVSVDEKGVLTANAIGNATIIVECAGKTKRVNVTVECFNKDGVYFDGIISDGEYVGEFIAATNGTISVKFAGMVKNGNLYMTYEIIHGDWSPLAGNWWLNDNIEFKLDRGTSHTVVFYEGVAQYSSNISYGSSKTDEIDGRYVTVVELCVENVPAASNLMVGFNGVNFGWLGALWNNELNVAYVSADGILIEKPIDLGNGLVLDGVHDEAIYTENVKNSMLSVDANGGKVDIIGTLTDEGVVFGVTVSHKKAVDVNTTTPYDWFTFMNIEFHFNGSNTQFIAIAHNRNSLGQIFTYCKTVESGEGYLSTFEIFIPYAAIGVSADVQSVEFTARGWFETGWCDLLGSSWNPTHKVSSDGISTK